jgi:putative transposase
MTDVIKAIKSNHKKKFFELKYRTIRDAHQNIVVHKKHWCHKRGVYSDLFGSSVIRSVEPLPLELPYDSRLIKNRLGHYYICIPMDLSNNNQVTYPSIHATVALDPGVRTFMTCYDADGKATEWGKLGMGRIYRLQRMIDQLQSKWSHPDVRHSRRYRLKRAGRRIRLKIRNMMDEIHKKLSKWLCSNFKCILIPKFEVSNMVRKKKRRIGSKTTRFMYTWAHYRFRQRLISKAREYPQCHVIVTQEPYTTKTCGCCGSLNHHIGSSKTFGCDNCQSVIDRDINGARNILIRYMTLP